MTNDDLSNALGLQPLVDSTMSFVDFLKELKGNEDRVATAPAIVLKAIHDLGMEDPREETNPERRRFLEVLKKVGIPFLEGVLPCLWQPAFCSQTFEAIS